jgi:hypothetical protein
MPGTREAGDSTASLGLSSHSSLISHISAQGVKRHCKTNQALQPAAHGEYVVTWQDGVRLESGRSYSDKFGA